MNCINEDNNLLGWLENDAIKVLGLKITPQQKLQWVITKSEPLLKVQKKIKLPKIYSEAKMQEENVPN